MNECKCKQAQGGANCPVHKKQENSNYRYEKKETKVDEENQEEE